MGSLNLASGLSGKPGEGREAELASWTRCFGTTGKVEDTLTWEGRGGWAHSHGFGHPKERLMDVVYYCSVHHGKQMAPGEMEPLQCRRADPGGDGDLS